MGKLSRSESVDPDDFNPPQELPGYESTPKRAKIEYQCQYCDKVYFVKFYFIRHVQTHTTGGVSNEDVANTSDAVVLDVSDAVSFSKINDSIKSKPKAQFKAPPKRGPPKKKFICTYCLKGYVCSSSFKSHLRQHAIQDAAARFPNRNTIEGNAVQISSAALTAVANAHSYGINGHRFREFMGYIISISQSEKWNCFALALCKEYMDCTVTKKCVLPSALLSTLCDKNEDILSNFDLCAKLLGSLDIPLEFEDHTQSQFFLEFVLHFAKTIISFISKHFCDSYAAPHQKEPLVLDKDDRQVIYYIGGSIIRGYLRIATRYKKSKTWQEINRVLREKVLCDKPPPDTDAAWTLCVDRGGLLYITPQCQKFFLSLTEVVFANEQRDGSIDFEIVIEKALSCDVSVKWDAVISDSLSECNSLSLMSDVIKCFSRTCIRGFAKRRLNFLKERPVVSMPLRHAVARRKTK